jgi:hypothetical protein
VAQPERVMSRVVVGASFETKQRDPARMEGEVVDELGERSERPSREEKEYFWIMERINGVGNRREGRVSLGFPRALRASLLRRLRALHLHSHGGPRLLPAGHCPLPPRDQSLRQMRIRQTLQSRLKLPEGYER